MDPNYYRFVLTWAVDHPRGAVFDALVRIDEYPRWWPDYRRVTRIDEDAVAIALRSSLPYTLRLTNRFVIRDAAGGHFRLALDGDIAGWIDFAVTSRADGSTTVHITQECTARKRLLRVFAPVARGAFAHNHALTMRRGHRGLTRLLAAGRQH
ncbi:polyketide cyclase [Saccharothrix sp. BKS2]|uniref:polyketide cyclase n=1 Tax=Saccharothrix sp. BKS2 TaxID=3064400 RepID=UPI0039E7BB11